MEENEKLKSNVYSEENQTLLKHIINNENLNENLNEKEKII